MRKLVDFIPLDNGLRIVLLPEGWQELAERVEDKGDDAALNPDAALYDLTEWQLGNGWEMVAPEEIGALTDAPIFSQDTERDDHGKLVHVGTVYADMNYQIRSAVRVLWEQGEVTLSACN